jgi:hypothetical protein
MSASRIMAVLLLLAAGGRAAHAGTGAGHVTVRQAHPWGFAASFSWMATGVPAFASIGAAAERAFGRWFAVEVGAETGLTAAAVTETRMEPQLVTRLGARPTLPLDAQERNTLFLSLGPQVLVGGTYDRLLMAHTEAGYHLRTWSGVSLLAAAVANFSLSQGPPGMAYGTRSIGLRVALGADF